MRAVAWMVMELRDMREHRNLGMEEIAKESR